MTRLTKLRAKHLRSAFAIMAAAAALTACEAPEDRLARETQFDGATLDNVVSKIGPPDINTEQQAVWNHRNTYTNRVPIRHYVNGRWHTVGYRNERVVSECSYTATLDRGRVVASKYEGNSCRRFAPDLS